MSRMVKISESAQRTFFTSSFLAVGAGSSLITLGLHTFFINKYAELYQLYDKGFEVEISKDLETMLRDSADDLQTLINKPPTKMFHTIGFETNHFGSTITSGGGMIGLPVTFRYKSPKDVDRKLIMINGKGVSWDSADGEKFSQSLIISDLAKRFAIAYELALVDSYKLICHAVCGPIAVMSCVQVNNYFCDAFGLPFRAFHIKSVFYVLLAFFGTGIYCLLKDFSTQYFENRAINRVAAAGPEYIKGGIEYYEKLLMRNQALRNLMENGASEFNTKGDYSYLFRQKHLPISFKKELLEDFRPSSLDNGMKDGA